MSNLAEKITEDATKSLAVITTVPGFITSAEIISKLRAKYDGQTYDVSTTAGMAKAVEARRELREVRVALDKEKPKVKKEALDFCAKVEADYKMLRSAVSEYEDIPDEAIKAEEKRKEEEKTEKARIAAEAQKALDDKIIEIGKLPLRCVGKNSEEIALFLATLEAKEIGGEFAGETRNRAEQAKSEAVAEIRIMHKAMVEAEENAAIAKAEQEAEVARQEADRVERERVDAIKKKVTDLREVYVTPTMTSADVELIVEACKSKIITNDEYQEFYQEAFTMNQTTITALCKIHGELVAREAADAQMKIDQEKLVKEREAFEAEQKAANAKRAEEDRIAREKQEAAAAEEKRKSDEEAAKVREEERQAAIVAEQKRVEAEKERKAAEKKAKLAEARCKDAETALVKILNVCRDETITDSDARAQVSLIAEASL